MLIFIPQITLSRLDTIAQLHLHLYRWRYTLLKNPSLLSRCCSHIPEAVRHRINTYKWDQWIPILWIQLSKVATTEAASTILTKQAFTCQPRRKLACSASDFSSLLLTNCLQWRKTPIFTLVLALDHFVSLLLLYFFFGRRRWYQM